MNVVLAGRVKHVVKHEIAVSFRPTRYLGLRCGVCSRKVECASNTGGPGEHLAVGCGRREALAVLPVSGAGCVGQELAALAQA